MRVIDGSVGGGQILRSSLALSMVTGEPVHIENVRAGRKKPGLMRQHLTAVRAAQAVASAEVVGDAIGSTSVEFRPGAIVPGQHAFHISTAGSAGLVLQTVLPALLTASGPSHLELRGGTHNAWAPPFDFIERVFLPLIERMGPRCSAAIQRHGFYPAGGGRFTVDVQPSDTLGALELLQRGAHVATRGSVLIAQISQGIANREVVALAEHSDLERNDVQILRLPNRQGPGNAVLVEFECVGITELFSAFGKRGVKAEQVAKDVADQFAHHAAGDAPVGPYLADQLLLPMAIGGGGTFRTSRPVDDHLTTNATLIREWLGVGIEVTEESADVAFVSVTGARLRPRR